MKISFPARYMESHSFAADESFLANAVQIAFQTLGWTCQTNGSGEFQTPIGFNLWSFGEKLTVKISGGDVTVKSECAMPTQCFDWGKNKRNVAAFLAEFNRIVKDSPTINALDDDNLSPLERIISAERNSAQAARKTKAND